MPVNAMNDWLIGAGVKRESLAKVSLSDAPARAARTPASAPAASASLAAAGPLPSTMLADCKIVHGKVPGPKNHLLCEKHGHVVDIDRRMIIARSVDEYRRSHAAPTKTAPRPGNGATAAAASGAGQMAGNVAAAQAAAAGTATASAAPAVGDPAAEMKKIINLMKIEQEGFESYVQTYTDFQRENKSSLLNRGVAAISQALNDSDDPGDELEKMRAQLMMEQMAGMGAAGTFKFDEARKHLEAMRTIAENARKLILHFTTDDSGASRAVTGLKVVSKAGDVATEGLNVVAPPIGKGLSVAKKAGVAAMQVHLGQPVNWAEFTVEVGCDLFFDKIGGGELAKRVGGPLTSKLVAKFGKTVSKEVIEKSVENVIKYEMQTVAKTTAGGVYEAAKGKEITYQEFLSRMIDKMTDPSELLFAVVNSKIEGELRK